MYPVSLNITGRLCVVVGGGKVAERKVSGLLAACGRVRVISPVLTGSLRALADRGSVAWREKPYGAGDLDDAFLVFAATDQPAVQTAVQRDARAAGLLANIADAPEACDFQIPAAVRRGDLLLTVSTSGRSPAVSAMIRRQLECEFGEEYGLLTDLLGEARDRILAGPASPAERKARLQEMFHADILDWLRSGRWDRIEHHLNHVLGDDALPRPADSGREG